MIWTRRMSQWRCARYEPCYQLFSPLATSSCPVMLYITTFSYTSSSKTRLALDCPKLIKKEALVEMMLGQDQDTHDSLERNAKQITSVS